jgi:hypothetical protein
MIKISGWEWSGVVATGTLTPPRANEMANCGFWVGLDSVSADNAKTQATVWTFPPDRPSNDSGKNCVQMSYSTTLNQWALFDDNCSTTYFVACQLVTAPEVWTISNRTMSWYEAYDVNKTNTATICPPDYKLEAPATPMQKSALGARMLISSASNVWIKLNDIDTEGVCFLI